MRTYPMMMDDTCSSFLETRKRTGAQDLAVALMLLSDTIYTCFGPDAKPDAHRGGGGLVNEPSGSDKGVALKPNETTSHDDQRPDDRPDHPGSI